MKEAARARRRLIGDARCLPQGSVHYSYHRNNTLVTRPDATPRRRLRRHAMEAAGTDASRDDAMRRYQAEMAQFRDEQLAELSKLTLDGFDEGEDTEDEDLGDWTDIARRAREHAGLPPDPDERLGPAHGA